MIIIIVNYKKEKLYFESLHESIQFHVLPFYELNFKRSYENFFNEMDRVIFLFLFMI